MQLLNKEEDEYNHLYALDPAQVENKELDQITMLKDNMEYMLQELEQAINSKHWNKLKFNEWHRKMVTLCGMESKEAGKPAESMIANLIETNVYLTRKLAILEANTPAPAQNDNHDPSTAAMPMLMQRQPTWATIASQPTKPRQAPHPKPGKLTQQKPTLQGTSADP